MALHEKRDAALADTTGELDDSLTAQKKAEEDLKTCQSDLNYTKRELATRDDQLVATPP